MIQNRLRILCLYNDQEPSYLEADPEFELRDHEVTIFETYVEAKTAIQDSTRGIPPFDVVLADVSVPGGKFEDGFDDFPFSPVLLQPYLSQVLVRGLGVFAPEDFETTFESSDGFAVLVASKECRTPFGTRDWRKLLELVLKASDEADQFRVRD